MTDIAPTRKAGKRGARESHEPRLLLSQFRAPQVSPGYQEWDGSHGITAWGMDGNDSLGDCGAAATDHGNMAKANNAALLNALGTPTFAGTIATYYAYGEAQGEVTAPGAAGPDEGVDNASWLGFLYKNGIIDGYGEVPLDELDAYAQDFNGLLLAVALDDQAEQQFEASQPWNGPPDQSEGHDIWLIITHADGSIEVVTWGAIQAATLDFRTNNITDAWAILDESDAMRAGVNWSGLQAALSAVHGTVAPITPPAPPEPAPVTPQPSPVVSSDLLDQLRAEADQLFDDARAEAHRLIDELDAHLSHFRP
jgi:hypothetical protein